jgi:excisionase family DNA binding protein
MTAAFKVAPIPVEDQIRRMTPIAAPPEQRADVEALFQLLDHASHVRKQRRACRLMGPTGEEIRIPDSIFYVLERVAEVMARGDSITVVPVGKEMTTQQAADLLNVSRQYLVRLLDEGRIPHTKTGRHRRLRIEDVIAFKEQRDNERKASLDELTRLSEDFGGYPELEP